MTYKPERNCLTAKMQKVDETLHKQLSFTSMYLQDSGNTDLKDFKFSRPLKKQSKLFLKDIFPLKKRPLKEQTTEVRLYLGENENG